MDFNLIISVIFVIFCVLLSTKAGKNVLKVVKNVQKEVKETEKEARETAIELFGSEISEKMFDEAEDALDEGLKTAEEIAREWIKSKDNDFSNEDFNLLVKFILGTRHKE